MSHYCDRSFKVTREFEFPVECTDQIIFNKNSLIKTEFYKQEHMFCIRYICVSVIYYVSGTWADVGRESHRRVMFQ